MSDDRLNQFRAGYAADALRAIRRTAWVGCACCRSPADGRLRLIAGLALFALASITAIVSNLHALAVVRAVGNTGAVVYLIPCVADLMTTGRAVRS